MLHVCARTHRRTTCGIPDTQRHTQWLSVNWYSKTRNTGNINYEFSVKLRVCLHSESDDDHPAGKRSQQPHNNQLIQNTKQPNISYAKSNLPQQPNTPCTYNIHPPITTARQSHASCVSTECVAVCLGFCVLCAIRVDRTNNERYERVRCFCCKRRRQSPLIT